MHRIRIALDAKNGIRFEKNGCTVCSDQFRVDAIETTEGATINCGRRLHATNLQVPSQQKGPKHRVATTACYENALAHCLLSNKTMPER